MLLHVSHAVICARVSLSDFSRCISPPLAAARSRFPVPRRGNGAAGNAAPRHRRRPMPGPRLLIIEIINPAGKVAPRTHARLITSECTSLSRDARAEHLTDIDRVSRQKETRDAIRERKQIDRSCVKRMFAARPDFFLLLLPLVFSRTTLKT